MAAIDMQDIPNPGQDPNWLAAWKNFKKIRNQFNTFNVKDYGAKGDGVTDDTASINAAIAAANTAGGGCVFAPIGVYIVSSPINILSNIDFYGVIGATIFKAKSTFTGDGYSGIITLRSGCQNSSLSDFVVDGNKAQVPASTTYVGIAALGCNNVSFRRIISKNVNQFSGGGGGDGLYINYDNNNTASVSRYLKFYDCTFDASVRQGCSIIDGYALDFYSCVFSGTTGINPGAGVDIEPNNNTATVSQVGFYNCVFYGNAGRGVLISNGNVATIQNISFVDCKSYNNGNSGATINGENQDQGISLVRCEFTNNGSDEIVVGKSTGLSIIDCYIHDSPYNGILLEHNIGSRTDNYLTEIRGNRIITIGKNGIRVDAGIGGGPAVNIFRNNIINCSNGSLGTYFGINFTASAAHNFGAAIMYNTIQSISLFPGSGYMGGVNIPVNCNKISVMFNYFDGIAGNSIVNSGTGNLIFINFDGAVINDADALNSSGIGPLLMNGNLTVSGIGEGILLNRNTGGGYIKWQDGSKVDKFVLVRNNTQHWLTLHANGATNAGLAGSQIFNIRNDLNSADALSIDTETGVTTLNGNLKLKTLGNGLQIKAGVNGRINLGNVLAAGTLTVANTSVTSNTVIAWNRVVSGGTLGHITITRSAGVGYTITSSSATETSTIDVTLTEAT